MVLAPNFDCINCQGVISAVRGIPPLGSSSVLAVNLNLIGRFVTPGRQKEGTGVVVVVVVVVVCVGVVTTPWTFLPVFLTMNMTFNINKFWYGVR